MDELRDELNRMFPAHSPEEMLVEWQRMNLEAIEDGWLIANLLPGGDVLYNHIDNASPYQIATAMTPLQYRLWIEPAASGICSDEN
jgi:hypothetical protein